jgi:hypothetical protein
MITAAFTLLVAVAVDPRPALLELQLQNRNQEALVLTQRELQDHPGESRSMGLDYLRGHLLHVLGDAAQSSEAFGACMADTPDLALHSRYRMALEQEEMGHPEVAAGLVAGVVGKAPSSSLAPDAMRLLVRTLARGGDCRLLGGIPAAGLSFSPRPTVPCAAITASWPGASCSASCGRTGRTTPGAPPPTAWPG